MSAPALPPKGVTVEWCMVCEVAVHETICDRCGRLVCYGCMEDNEPLCVECAAEDEADDA